MRALARIGSSALKTKAIRIHERRSRKAQKIDEALKADKVPTTKQGLESYRASKNRLDYPGVDTKKRK